MLLNNNRYARACILKIKALNHFFTLENIYFCIAKKITE